jgi:peptide deformylase
MKVLLESQGNTVLRKEAYVVTPADLPGAWSVGRQMLKVLKKHKTGVGLAAPQVGIQAAIFVLDVPNLPEYLRGEVVLNGRTASLTELRGLIVINPTVVAMGDPTVEGEGCFSLPGQTFAVSRPSTVFMSFIGGVHSMRECTLKADGFLSRAIQHEFDHCRGVLIDGMEPNS